MITINAELLNKRPMTLRHAVRDGNEVGLMFRGSIYATVVPVDQLAAERAELAELRKRVANPERGGV